MKIVLVQEPNTPSGNTILPKHIEQIKRIAESATVLLIVPEKIREHLSDTEIFLMPTRMIGNIDIQKATRLKWVHVTSAGVNNLNEDFLHSDILLTNSSGVHPIPISEQILTYMLLFARNMHKTFRNQLEHSWISHRELNVFELHEKTIGIVGLGRIGERTAMLAKAIGMKVIALVRNKREKQKWVDVLYTSKELGNLLQKSDFVINCLPGTKETYHIFDKDAFSKMNPTSYFINIGRGSTVNEEDLIFALKNHIIQGAGLDVFEKEPLPENSPLWTMENVIITPHNAGLTPFYMDRVVDIFCENLEAFLTRHSLPNVVDKKLGY